MSVARVTRKLMAGGDNEISSRQIGELVMEQLQGLDQVAYVRFASVYRQFEDVDAFREEIDRLQQQLSPEERRQQLDLLQDETEGKS